MKTSAHHKSAAEDTTVETLLEDAHDLLTATAHVAEDKVVEARKRLMAALEKGREGLAIARDRAVAGAQATDRIVRTHPYQSMAVALGVGVIAGYLLSRRNRS